MQVLTDWYTAPVAKIEGNHRLSLGLGHYYLFQLYKCSQISYRSVVAAGLLQLGRPYWKFVASQCMEQPTPRL